MVITGRLRAGAIEVINNPNWFRQPMIGNKCVKSYNETAELLVIINEDRTRFLVCQKDI